MHTAWPKNTLKVQGFEIFLPLSIKTTKTGDGFINNLVPFVPKLHLPWYTKLQNILGER